MAFKLSDFASAFKGGGARSSLFEVSLSGTAPAGNLSNLKFLCRATTIPPSNIAPIDVPFLGRVIKVAGDRTFEPWTITILNDEDFAIRNVLERWMDQIKSHQGIRQSRSSISGYQRNMVLTQYTKNAKKSQQYTFVNAWPSSVSEIALAWDAPTVEEFTCTWNYDYWTSKGARSTLVPAVDSESTTPEAIISPEPTFYTPSAPGEFSDSLQLPRGVEGMNTYDAEASADLANARARWAEKTENY